MRIRYIKKAGIAYIFLALVSSFGLVNAANQPSGSVDLVEVAKQLNVKPTLSGIVLNNKNEQTIKRDEASRLDIGSTDSIKAQEINSSVYALRALLSSGQSSLVGSSAVLEKVQMQVPMMRPEYRDSKTLDFKNATSISSSPLGIFQPAKSVHGLAKETLQITRVGHTTLVPVPMPVVQHSQDGAVVIVRDVVQPDPTQIIQIVEAELSATDSVIKYDSGIHHSDVCTDVDTQNAHPSRCYYFSQ